MAKSTTIDARPAMGLMAIIAAALTLVTGVSPRIEADTAGALHASLTNDVVDVSNPGELIGIEHPPEEIGLGEAR